MPSRRLLACLAVALAIVTLLPAAALAENKAHSFEIGGALSWVRPDPDADLSNHFAPRMILGYNFTRRHGVEVLYDSFNATPDRGPSFPININVLRLGYTFNAYPKEKIVSFFRFGAGLWAVDPVDPPSTAGVPSTLRENDTNYLFYSGGGFRYFLRDNLALRFAATIDFVQTTPGIANNEVEATGEIGVTFLLGGKEESSSE